MHRDSYSQDGVIRGYAPVRISGHGDNGAGGHMKYGVQAVTRPDSMWGRTIRWRSGRHGQPLAFDTMEQAQEAAKAFNDQHGPLNDIYEHTAAPLEQEEIEWTIQV